MNKILRRILAIFLSVIAILVVIIVVYLFIPQSSDYGTFIKMRDYQNSMLEQYGSRERSINQYFADYKLNLPLLYQIMFKAKNLSLYLKSYQTDKIAVATINQLEIGNDSENFFDFTFMIRPKPRYNIPLFHGDALKALPGVTSALYMDFYSLNDEVDAQYFFRNTREKLKQAMVLAKPYWKNKGFGELTPHLDPFKSPWRLEMIEPEKGTEAEKRKYYETVYTCFTLYLQAYMEALSDYDLIENQGRQLENQHDVENFVSILYEKDMAVKMGKMIFPVEDFDKYFLDGFWGVPEK